MKGQKERSTVTGDRMLLAAMRTDEVAEWAGVTYRQLDRWVREQVVPCSIEAQGSGTYRGFTAADAETAMVVGRLARCGAPLSVLRWAAGQVADLIARDVHDVAIIVSPDAAVRTVAEWAAVGDILRSVPGAWVVAARDVVPPAAR